MSTETLSEFKIDQSSWKQVKFGDVVTEPRENTRNILADGFKHIVGLEHIDSADIHLRKSFSADTESTFSKVFRKGDVLFGRRRAYLKKAAVAGFEGVCSGDITVFRAKEELLLPELLPFLVHNDRFFDHAIKHSAGGLSPRVKFKDLANYEFLLPPKEEQQRLAELLWAMDEVIEKEKKVLERLDEIYISTIEKELLDLKKGKVFLSEMGRVIRGVGYKPEDLQKEINEHTCIILRSNNIANGKINYDDTTILHSEKVKKDQFLEIGDFAICMSNGSKELVGKAARFLGNKNAVSVGSFCAGFRPDCNRNSVLLQHLFSSETYRQKIKRTLSGSAINNLKPSDLEELFFKFDLESLATDVIIDRLNKIIISKSRIEDCIIHSQSLQKSLLNQIF